MYVYIYINEGYERIYTTYIYYTYIYNVYMYEGYEGTSGLCLSLCLSICLCLSVCLSLSLSIYIYILVKEGYEVTSDLKDSTLMLKAPPPQIVFVGDDIARANARRCFYSLGCALV